MKLLLTSGGVTNDAIRSALLAMLGKSIDECDALLIPTAQWGQPACSPQTVWMSTAGRWPGETGLVDLGWKSVGLLELTALPSIGGDRWRPWVQAADVLPSLADTVWVGVSAGSMVMTPRIGPEFVDWRPGGSDETLGVVDFSIFPHLDYPGWDENTSDAARRWAAKIAGPAYAIDDQTAISVVDGAVEVVSEGRWTALNT